ncbi:MAG: glycosyltransferase, partial [Acidobacteriota bacterium]
MSLFHIDAGKEWRGGQRQSLFLVKELQKEGYPVHFVVQPRSPLHRKAVEAGLSVLPLRIKSEADLWAVLRLTWAMRRRKCRLVHLHDAHAVAVGGAAARRAKVPLRFISRRVDFPVGQNALSRRKYTKDVDAII